MFLGYAHIAVFLESMNNTVIHGPIGFNFLRIFSRTCKNQKDQYRITSYSIKTNPLSLINNITLS